MGGVSVLMARGRLAWSVRVQERGRRRLWGLTAFQSIMGGSPTSRISSSKMSTEPGVMCAPRWLFPSARHRRKWSQVGGLGVGVYPSPSDALSVPLCLFSPSTGLDISRYASPYHRLSCISLHPSVILCGGKKRLDGQASSDGTKSCHLSPSFISCMASVQPATTCAKQCPVS